MFKVPMMLRNGEPDATGGGVSDPVNPLAGGAVDPAPTGTPNDPPPANPLAELYGDLAGKIEWPEGFTDDMKTAASFKPFVGQDGKINFANMAKSYLHQRTLIGNKNAVMLPDENSTDEQRAEFFEKLGFVKNPEEYKIELPEGTKVSKEFADSLKQVLHKNYVPPKVANELVKFLDEQTKATETKQAELQKQQFNSNIDALKKDFGDAFNDRVGKAKKLLDEVLSDQPELRAAFDDPAIGTNPAVVKLLAKIAQEAYEEDNAGVAGKATGGKMTPSEAAEEINRIYGDKNDAFHKKSHPSHASRQKYMLDLFKMKNGG